MSFEAAVHAQAIDLDKLSLEMCAAAGSGHPSSAMSLGHLVTVLMFHSMRWSPEHPDYPTSDRLVLSNGHAVPIVYAAYARLGGLVGREGEPRHALTVEEVMNLRKIDSLLEGHPNPQEGFPFFDAATGSLGQGLSVAAGLAEAARLDSNPRRVYCLIGDGEAREGQISEALDYLVDQRLTKVLPIFSCNAFGQAGRVSDQQSPDRLAAKLQACGFDVSRIDGHNPAEIRAAFEAFAAREDDPEAAPTALVATTQKGWGSPTLQAGNWHGKPPTGDTLARVNEELDQRRIELTSSLVQSDQFMIQPPAEPPEVDTGVDEAPTLSETMRRFDMESVLHTGRMATRKAYGLALRAMGHINPNLVVLDADVSNSTYSETFAKDQALAERFFECRIAEQNMISVAAGMAAAGKTPFVNSFAKFITRAYDQIEMAINSGANIKIVGSHSGVSLAADGPSQMALPDIAWFRSFTTMRDHRGNPGCYVLQPSDAYAAYALANVMAEYEGACYMRTHRPDTEFLYSDDAVFNLGGFEVLSEGRDLLIVASGYMVHEGNKVIEELDKQGVAATLIDLYSLPFDGDKLLDYAQSNNGYVITLEDNYGAAIGSAVADVMAESGDAFSLKQMYVSRIPKSGLTPEEVLTYCGISADDVVRESMRLLEVGLV